MKIIAFIFPIVLCLVFLGVKILSPYTYALVIQEDSAIEYAQAAFYFLASIVSFLTFVVFLRGRLWLHSVLFGVLAFGLLFIFLEEVSWGQRIFNLELPSFFAQYNVQQEISIHNLELIQSKLHNIYILTGAFGAFSWLFMRALSSKGKWYHVMDFVVPDWFLSSYFLVTFVMYLLLEYIARPYAGGFLVWRDQEPVELLLSLGFLFFTLTKYMRSRACLITASV